MYPVRVATIFFSLFLLSGCGQDVCVSGFGNCEKVLKKPEPIVPKPPVPAITAPSTHVKAGDRITLTVTNGTAPFMLSIVSGWGQLAVTGARTAEYEAPDGMGVVVFKVRDADRREATLSLVID